MATFQAIPWMTGLQVYPGGKKKALLLCELLIEVICPGVGGVLTLESALPEG